MPLPAPVSNLDQIHLRRREIERDYVIARGLICSPGKFEGEPIYVPYFYAWFGEGNFASEPAYTDLGAERFEIDDDERAVFPELGNAASIVIREDDNGFVYVDLEHTR